MRQVRTRRGGRGSGVSPVPSRNPYLDLLRSPGALAFSATGFVGRMSMSMYGLGTVLLITSMTGRYGLAGTIAGAGSIGYAIFGPLIAQQADRLGQRPVLLAQACVFGLSGSAFIASAVLRAPVWLLFVTGIISGGSMPSLGSMVRTRWSSILGQDSRRLHTAFALESVNDELIFVIGPALVTLLATQVVPASGIGTAVGLCFAGTLLFALQRSTEPAPQPAKQLPGKPQASAATSQAGSGALDNSPQPALRRGIFARIGRPSIPAAGLITLAPAFLLLGSLFASIDLSTVAFAAELGHKPDAGLILGTYALGSATGGLWYGTRHWKAPIGRRFTITAAIAVTGFSTFWAMPGLLALDGVGFLAGLAVAPTLMAGYSILEQQAPQHRRTEAMAYLGSTISVGVAFGSALVGRIIDADGARWGFVFAASCGLAAVLVCLAGLSRLRTDHDRELEYDYDQQQHESLA